MIIDNIGLCGNRYYYVLMPAVGLSGLWVRQVINGF